METYVLKEKEKHIVKCMYIYLQAVQADIVNGYIRKWVLACSNWFMDKRSGFNLVMATGNIG